MGKKEKIIFLHIPKTAGTTLNCILRRQYSSDEFYQIEQAVFNSKEGLKRKANLEPLISLSDNEKRKIRCISGHLHFGIHKLLHQRFLYFTMLRDPVERVISHYYHIVGTPNNFLHNEIISRNINLEDYVVKAIHSDAHNGQVRRLCGDINNEVGTFSRFPTISHSELIKAKKNLLEYFPVFGITERFDESLLLFKKAFGWGNIFYIKIRVGQNRPNRKSLPKQTEEIIKQHNIYDLELYEFALKRFDQLLENYGINRSKIEHFRNINSYLGKYFCIYHSKIQRIRKKFKKS